MLLLNPDTVVPPGAIADAGPRRSPRTRRPRPPARASSTQPGVPELSFGWPIGPLGELRQKVVWRPRTAARCAAIVRTVDRVDARRPATRDWVSGACLLVRRADLEAVGLLDERYFMYTEDVDLCVALRQRGRTILFVPRAEVCTSAAGRPARNPAAPSGCAGRARSRTTRSTTRRWAPLLRCVST